MDKREWLTHRALDAALTYMNEPNNPSKGAAFDDAIQALCPVCEHSIIYCRCYENTDRSMLSRPNREYRSCLP